MVRTTCECQLKLREKLLSTPSRTAEHSVPPRGSNVICPFYCGNNKIIAPLLQQKLLNGATLLSPRCCHICTNRRRHSRCWDGMKYESPGWNARRENVHNTSRHRHPSKVLLCPPTHNTTLMAIGRTWTWTNDRAVEKCGCTLKC